MSTSPGAAGLLWLWAAVAELGPGDPQSSRPAQRPIVIMGAPLFQVP
jgi:hypothetical protein